MRKRERERSVYSGKPRGPEHWSSNPRISIKVSSKVWDVEWKGHGEDGK